MKSTVVDESLSSFKPMYCSREYQASTRLIQQYEKSTLNYLTFFRPNKLSKFYGSFDKWDCNFREIGDKTSVI